MARFDSFVLFAEMRTGSNFLEANLNALPGVICLGEAFNPSFIGYPNSTDLCGVTLAERQVDPLRLLSAIRAQEGKLTGFRYFHDHDPRILDILLNDRNCAKIILTRNPIESHVSHKIAAATGQWKLTNASKARSETVTIDIAEFEAHLERLQEFQLRLLRGLQVTGQTAFYLDYEDIQDLAVLNGLAEFLGIEARLDALNRKLKKQNPAPLSEKVANFLELEQALMQLDRFNLSRTPNFEPRRGPGVPGFLAAANSDLLYLPIRGGPEELAKEWLKVLDNTEPQGGFTHRTLRQWKSARPGHRSFTVIRHPLARAHAGFCDHILSTGPGSYPEIRRALRRQFALPLPEDNADWDDTQHRAAFLGYLGFLKLNLGGQTALRVDPVWASQTAVLQGMAGFALPDHILREEDLPRALPALAAQVGRRDAPIPQGQGDPHAERLARIVTPKIEALAREIYQRDYMGFGFGDWQAPTG